MTGERVLGRVVGEQQDTERRQDEDRGPSGDGSQPEHRPEDAHQELQLLRLKEDLRQPAGMGEDSVENLLWGRAQLRIAVIDSLGKVLVGTAAEGRNDDAYDRHKCRKAAGKDSQ